jgi:stearoyl-CoA desaturase (delta-9 desaturase)
MTIVAPVRASLSGPVAVGTPSPVGRAAEVAPPEAATPVEEVDRIDWSASIPFLLVHLAALGGTFALGLSWRAVAYTASAYVFGMFWVTAGYHRYFSHKTFKTSRAMQFVFAFFAQTTIQKGALWWAAHHRHHHRHSDKEPDVHSMKLKGFLYSHVGWILSRRWNRTEIERIPDLAKYPELVWLDRYHVVPVVLYALVWTLAAGWHGLLYGFAVPSVLLWHGTFAINSLAHWRGSRRFKTVDESKNNPLLAIIMLGEGWHNNHHFYCKSTRQGFYWWEIDITYYILRAMAVVGLVHDIHEPPPHVLALGRGEKLTPKRDR